MADTKLAKIGLTPKGPWAADISYEVLDVTLYSTANGGDGCSYVAMRDNIGVTPGTDDSAWLKLSQAGQSIYDLAVKYHHFDGTEEEFEQQYQAVLQAARDAATATLATNTEVQNAETLRVAAEQERVSAEAARADAEALRASAELTRENNETARGNAESVRVSAESGRATAENGRVSAESGREAAESERASAETSRRSEFESLESDMQTAIGQADAATAAAVALNEQVAGDEADRVAAETARETAESGRVSAESARVTAESGRVTAESGRVSAESARVSAETARVAQASSDHTRAESDHGTAATDHTTAGADHTQAGADHTASETATAAANTAAAAADAARESIQDDLAALGHKVLNNYFIGKNNTYSTQIVRGLKPGGKYRVIVRDPSWDMSGVTITGAYRFGIINYYNGTETTLKSVIIGNPVNDYYDITIPANSDYIIISGRATAGVEVYFQIVPFIVEQGEYMAERYDAQQQLLMVEEVPVSGAAVYIRFANNTTLNFGPSTSNFTRAQIASSLGVSLATSPGGIANSIQFASGKSLVYNTASSAFFLRNINILQDNDILLLSVKDGRLVYAGEFLNTRIIAHTAAFSEVLYQSLAGEVFAFRNGTPGNAGNANCVTSIMLPTLGKGQISVTTTRPNTSGYRYVFGFVVTKSWRDVGNWCVIGSDYMVGPWTSYDVQLTRYNPSYTIPDGYVGVMIVIGESDGTNWHPLRLTDFNGYKVNIEFRNTGSNLVTERNADRIPMLTASCRWRKTAYNSQDFQVVIAADSHGDNICVGNAVKALNGFAKIDALVHCGDAVLDTFSLGEDVTALWKDIISAASKPFYFVIGNHDAGNYPGILYNQDDSTLYNAFIKPSVDAGHLSSGEYTANKCYYYHDFSARKIRLIVVDEYETPLVLDDTNWEAITYNSALSNYALNTAYAVGAEVNVPGYTSYSFRAKNAVTTKYYDYTIPSYKYAKGSRWISQTQAQWFLDTLASTPANYKVIVAMHNPFSAHADVVQSAMFSQKNGWTDGHGMQNYMTNDFFADAIDAFVSKSNFSTTCASTHPDEMPSYSVSKNFGSLNTGVSFHSFIGGHVHEDCVWKHQTYLQYQVTPVCSNSDSWPQSQNADIRRSSSSNSSAIDVDCLTVVSFGEGRLGLVKLGVNVNENGEKRDFEVIDITQ